MNPKLEKQLYEKYPKIFRQKDLPMTETCMNWGIETGDGWYWLLDQLCANIQSYIDNNQKINGVTQVEAAQVKEKFASLHFYIDGGNDFIDGMIHLAESMSYSICEVCGSTKDVTLNETGWMTVRCKKCRAKEEKNKALKK